MNGTTAPTIVISHYQASEILNARQRGAAAVSSSSDLGLTSAYVSLTPEGASFPDGTVLSWPLLEEVRSSENFCFRIVDGSPKPIRGYSELLGRSYSLLPTASAPALVIAGFPMHRIKDIDPRTAALGMLQTLAPIRGHMLDTATGLGYTAIEASRSADHVTTVELDPVAQDMARLNPWSRDLFDNHRITQVMGDSAEAIKDFTSEGFSCILHDPPTMRLAGDLYSGEFYLHAYRVLGRKGRMFHYIGDPDSRSGSSTTRGVIRRLQRAGFERVTQIRDAHGVVAHKS